MLKQRERVILWVKDGYVSQQYMGRLLLWQVSTDFKESVLLWQHKYRRVCVAGNPWLHTFHLFKNGQHDTGHGNAGHPCLWTLGAVIFDAYTLCKLKSVLCTFFAPASLWKDTEGPWSPIFLHWNSERHGGCRVHWLRCAYVSVCVLCHVLSHLYIQGTMLHTCSLLIHFIYTATLGSKLGQGYSVSSTDEWGFKPRSFLL